MFIIGVAPHGGLYSKAQFRNGLIPNPGTLGKWTDPATLATKEFISVKFTAAGNRVNGSLVTIDPDGVATLGTLDAGNILVNKRAGVLAYNASAVATTTMVGTHFGWAQVYGRGKGLATGTLTMSLVDQALEAGADGAVAIGAVGSASANLYGLTVAVASTYPPGLVEVFLNFPQYQNIAG